MIERHPMLMDQKYYFIVTILQNSLHIQCNCNRSSDAYPSQTDKNIKFIQGTEVQDSQINPEQRNTVGGNNIPDSN